MPDLFFELFQGLPRQGPGLKACTARALALCRDLPAAPTVLDLGCGSGAQTMHLAALLPAARIVAVDLHPPLIQRLRDEVARQGLAGRIEPHVVDMARLRDHRAALGLPVEGADLIWSEGALYHLGLGPALQLCRDLLRPGGCLAFTDAVWCRDDPPPEVRAAFEADYPGMGRVEDDLAQLRDAGFDLLGHFTLPDAAWWEDFYTPMQARIAELRLRHAGDAEALTMLDALALEPEMHRRHGNGYAYEFFVARRPLRHPPDAPHAPLA